MRACALVRRPCPPSHTGSCARRVAARGTRSSSQPRRSLVGRPRFAGKRVHRRIFRGRRTWTCLASSSFALRFCIASRRSTFFAFRLVSLSFLRGEAEHAHPHRSGQAFNPRPAVPWNLMRVCTGWFRGSSSNPLASSGCAPDRADLLQQRVLLTLGGLHDERALLEVAILFPLALLHLRLRLERQRRLQPLGDLQRVEDLGLRRGQRVSPVLLGLAPSRWTDPTDQPRECPACCAPCARFPCT